jgi:RNA polymerase sigma-70 factor, ECF subfamily
MSRVETFNQHRPLLMSIAYRMLGSRADAEDAVQETFLRYQAGDEELESPKAYLTTIVTRICIDHLRSARVQRESYVGQWLPEPVATTGTDIGMAESLTMAFLVLLENLSPVERAAFLLHDVFDYDYAEIAQMTGKTEANCRQMVHRAKERIKARQHRFDPSQEETDRITARFLETTRSGDMSGLMSLFSEDAVMISDGGGKANAALNPVKGADSIARFVLGVLRKNESLNLVNTLTEINFQPAFITRVSGRLAYVTVLDIRDGLIRNLFIVANPDKLGVQIL